MKRRRWCLRLQTIEYAVEKAFDLGKKVILNPAPATALSDKFYQCLYAITPNETETAFLTGIKVTNEAPAQQAAGYFIAKGVKRVIITFGASGAYLLGSGV